MSRADRKFVMRQCTVGVVLFEVTRRPGFECGFRGFQARIEVARFPWAASGRAQALGRTEGLTKLIVDPETDRVLGVGIVGVGAGELIAEGVLAIEMGCDVRDLTDSIHAHPTLSETLGFAGEVHFGLATEIYRPKR